MNDKSMDDDFEEITKQNFDRVSQAVGKIGYKEGAFDGRQSVFQQGFDEGYLNGFKNAFRLGVQIGQLNAATDNSNKLNVSSNKPTIVSPASTDLILNRPTRGQCVVCVDQNLINEDIDIVLNIQQKHTNKVNATLVSRYPIE